MPHFGVCGRQFRYVPEDEERYAAMRRERKANEAAAKVAAERELAHNLVVIPKALGAAEDPAEIIRLVAVLGDALPPEDYRAAWRKFGMARFRPPDKEIVRVEMRRSLGRNVTKDLSLRLGAWTMPGAKSFVDTLGSPVLDAHGFWWNVFWSDKAIKGKSHFEGGRAEATVALEPGQDPDFDSWRVQMLRYWRPKRPNGWLAGGPYSYEMTVGGDERGRTERFALMLRMMEDALVRRSEQDDGDAPSVT